MLLCHTRTGWFHYERLKVIHGYLFKLRNVGTSKRSTSRPFGEEKYSSVHMGNVLASRTLLLMMVAHTLGCVFILEQPKGSLMENLPTFQELLQKIPIWRHTLQMGHYGAPSKKPTWLYCSLSTCVLFFKGLLFGKLFYSILKPDKFNLNPAFPPPFKVHKWSRTFRISGLPHCLNYQKPKWLFDTMTRLARPVWKAGRI